VERRRRNYRYRLYAETGGKENRKPKRENGVVYIMRYDNNNITLAGGGVWKTTIVLAAAIILLQQ